MDGSRIIGPGLPHPQGAETADRLDIKPVECLKNFQDLLAHKLSLVEQINSAQGELRSRRNHITDMKNELERLDKAINEAAQIYSKVTTVEEH